VDWRKGSADDDACPEHHGEHQADDEAHRERRQNSSQREGGTRCKADVARQHAAQGTKADHRGAEHHEDRGAPEDRHPSLPPPRPVMLHNHVEHPVHHLDGLLELLGERRHVRFLLRVRMAFSRGAQSRHLRPGHFGRR
jgi:hypothetical protein